MDSWDSIITWCLITSHLSSASKLDTISQVEHCYLQKKEWLALYQECLHGSSFKSSLLEVPKSVPICHRYFKFHWLSLDQRFLLQILLFLLFLIKNASLMHYWVNSSEQHNKCGMYCFQNPKKSHKYVSLFLVVGGVHLSIFYCQ